MRTAAIWIAAAAVALALAAPARADVYDDNPATASRGGDDLWVFARATSGEILERHRSGGGWTDWSSLGGDTTSGPAAVAYGARVLVFARGSDGLIYQKTYTDGSWSGWVGLGGYSTSAPAVAVRRGPEGYIDIAIKGGDNAIWFQTYVPGHGWSGWGSRGGNLTSAPSLNSQSAGIVNIWARGGDGALKQMAWNGAAWSDWLNLEGGMIGAPAAVSRTENVLNVYVRGGGDATYQRPWSSGGWGPWQLLDGARIDSAPAAGGDALDHEWVVARRGSGVSIKEWTGTWGSWTDLGAVAVPTAPAAPPPAAPAPDGELDLVTGLRCTPAGGRLRVSVAIRKPKRGARARVTKIVFFTKGKGRALRVDRRSPFVVRIKVNRPAGRTGRVYARIHYRRSAKGKIHRKTVSRRYTVCR